MPRLAGHNACMRLGHRLVSLFLAGLVPVGLLTAAVAAPAHAAADLAGTVPTVLTMNGASGYAGNNTPLRIDLAEGNGTPVAAAEVLVERQGDAGWLPLGAVVTDDSGHAALDAQLSRTPSENVFRASYAGDDTHAGSETGPVRVALIRRQSVVRVGGPGTVVDEQQVRITVSWTTGGGDPVSGVVRVFRRDAGREWTRARAVRTGADGHVEFLARPRTDTRWRAQVVRRSWIQGDTSPVHFVDNLPPGDPVRLPADAPRPRIHLPAQAHAVGVGPNVEVGRIPDRVWRQMTGVTWHRGCPVGRAGLRHVRLNYWDYRGYRRRGEFVARADAAKRMAGALAEMYTRGFAIRSMYRVDRFGYSRRLHGGDDFASMAAGNTSVFNCRDVVNRPGVRSPHAYGRSLDLNTWENPYRSARGLVPNSWWQPHSHPRVAWRSRQHDVVEIMARHGLRWTYGKGDTQHFDAVMGNGRVMALPLGCDGICE